MTVPSEWLRDAIVTAVLRRRDGLARRRRPDADARGAPAARQPAARRRVRGPRRLRDRARGRRRVGAPAQAQGGALRTQTKSRIESDEGSIARVRLILQEHGQELDHVPTNL